MNSEQEVALRQALGVLRDTINRSLDPGLVRNDLVRNSEDLFELVEALITEHGTTVEEAEVDRIARSTGWSKEINCPPWSFIEDELKKRKEQRDRARAEILYYCKYECRPRDGQCKTCRVPPALADEPPKAVCPECRGAEQHKFSCSRGEGGAMRFSAAEKGLKCL
jgi:hypothetical protein